MTSETEHIIPNQPAFSLPPVGSQNSASVKAKRAIKAAGGSELALAIAMLEEKSLNARKYPFGDICPDGTPKTGDAGNFGIYKMNWKMIRECPSAIEQMKDVDPAEAWRIVGRRVNTDPALATKILLEAWCIWPVSYPLPGIAGNFWAGHRCGETGLNGFACVPEGMPGGGWQGILEYYHAVMNIRDRCLENSKVWGTRVRYYVFVPPI